MLRTVSPCCCWTPSLLATSSSSSSSSLIPLRRLCLTKSSTVFPGNSNHFGSGTRRSPMSWLGKLGFGFGNKASEISSDSSSIAQCPDDDIAAPGQQFAQFGAGCFWGVELAFQRVPGVTKTEVGYSQGLLDNPTYNDVCSGTTNHSEVIRVQYDPKECSYHNLLDVFWARHDPTTPNRQVLMVVARDIERRIRNSSQKGVDNVGSLT
ncbi:hypothetical protein Sjap_020137 [Stephania japonica]|uniref:peptide-methionine (S)-S-oxide reductase n=1 Tax=Stephania japonica TaxID=461633 RepID=A0AAP0HVC7_9MAGN